MGETGRETDTELRTSARNPLLREMLPEARVPVDSLDLNEVRALMRFARDHALGLERTAELAKLLDEDPISTVNIESIYGHLCAITYFDRGVTGRTVIDSAVIVPHLNRRIFTFAIAAFLVGALFDSLGSTIPETNYELYTIAQALEVLSPALWGFVGACVFLLTTFSEIAEDSRFDSRRVHGMNGRLAIGAIFGFIVVQMLGGGNLFTLELPAGAQLDIGKAASAFLAGMGAKAVYEIFQSMINTFEDIVTNVLRRLSTAAALKEPAKRRQPAPNIPNPKPESNKP